MNRRRKNVLLNYGYADFFRGHIKHATSATELVLLASQAADNEDIKHYVTGYLMAQEYHRKVASEIFA